jgi:small-conductance mechanosensitive channel
VNDSLSDLITSLFNSFKNSFFLSLSLYLAFKTINLNSFISRTIDIFFLFFLFYQFIKITEILIDYFTNSFSKKQKDEDIQNSILVISKIIKISLWIITALLIASNLGLNITSLMAGLGIGGIAIAFALQNILGDLFSSFAIYFDKPFVVGDFVIIGEYKGTVEKIGIKTTRLIALQGEEIIISNKELTTSKIQNFKKMKKRRIVFEFHLIYDTSLDKLKKVNLIIADIIKKEKLSEFDRIHFSKFNNFSLDFEVVYYILSGNYSDYMDTHQNILFEIKKQFEKEKISMAFPTQTIHLEK